MSALDVRIADRILDKIDRKYGNRWRNIVSRSVAEAIVASEVLTVVIGWGDGFTGTDVGELFRAAIAKAGLD